MGSTRRRAFDDAVNGLYGARQISSRSAGFGVESMHQTKSFLAEGFKGAVRQGRVNHGETALDSTKGSQVLHELVK